MRKIGNFGRYILALAYKSQLALIVLAAAILVPQASDAKQKFEPSISDWGGVGLIRTHNARFGPDGQLAFSSAFINQYHHFSLNLQALSWMQGTFRYTRSEDKIFNAGRETDTLVDRGADLKFSLLGETKWGPAVALGLQDLLGTGVFSGEYLVASKRWYDLDFSAGIAWGYLGTSARIANPMLQVSEEFRGREGGGGTGGNLEFLRFFSGERAALFAGIEYLTPITGLRLKLEYDGNDYSNERGGNTLEVASPFNIGLDYSPWPWLTIGAAVERGNTFQTRAVVSTGLMDYFGVPKFDKAPPPVNVREKGYSGATVDDTGATRMPVDLTSTVDTLFLAFEKRGLGIREVELINGDLWIFLENAWPSKKIAEEAAVAVAKSSTLSLGSIIVAHSKGRNGSAHLVVDARESVRLLTGAGQVAKATDDDSNLLMISQLEEAGFKVDSVKIGGRYASVHFENNTYRQVARAIGRVARVMANTAPPNVEYFEIVQTRDGLPLQATKLLRKDLENAMIAYGSPEEVWANAELSPGTYPAADSHKNLARYPDISWFLAPKLRQHVGRPQAFYKYQIWIQLGGELEMAPGLVFQTSVGRNIYNDFDEVTNVPASSLPHVRSEIVQYLQKGENNLVSLSGHYLYKLAPQIFGRLSGGYFEEMYAGYGGEVLFRPDNSRWAIGMEVHHVYQREFEQRFGLLKGEQEYDVVTGHLDVYWRTPIHDIDISASIGRYLAGDDGGTITIGRSFPGGVNVGAWFTVTDVSAEEFGEGSFDKGFSVSLPYDLFFSTSSQSSGTFAFRPLTRDGGQRVTVAKRLYGITSEGDVGLITQNWGRLFD